MGGCASVSNHSVVNGPSDHKNANRNAMYPVKSYDYQRRTTALVFPTVQKDLHPPEFNWSSSSSDAGDEGATNNVAANRGASSPDSDAELFSTLRPSEKRGQSVLPADLTSPEDIPLVQLHQARPPTGGSRPAVSDQSATVRYMENTLVPDPHGSRSMRSLKDAVEEHENDRRAVQAASRRTSRPNSASGRSNPLIVPPPLTFGVRKDDSDDDYGEL